MTTLLENLNLNETTDDNNNKTDKNSNQKSLLNFKKTIQIGPIRADLICVDYSDKIFISITSTGKLGSTLIVRGEKLGEEQIFSVKTLFGIEENLLEVFARSLAENLAKKHSITKPLLLSIGFEKKNLTNIQLFQTLEKASVDFYKSNV